MNTRTVRTSVLRLDPSNALIARTGHDGLVARRSIERGPDSQSAYFARIVDATDEHDCLIVLGPGYARLAFEREYVEICHRPDRLVDVPA
jgi:hypothetical protein